jgi:hypothetical protein
LKQLRKLKKYEESCFFYVVRKIGCKRVLMQPPLSDVRCGVVVFVAWCLWFGSWKLEVGRGKEKNKLKQTEI